MNHNFAKLQFALIAGLLGLFACSATKPPSLSAGHLQPSEQPVEEQIPKPVTRTPFLPEPTLLPKQETYTVVVNDVPLKELLFALARDAKLNVDIHPGIQGNVTVNAVNQTLPQILNRISDQIPVQYKLEGNSLAISPDLPVFRYYKVDYVSMKRSSISKMSVATKIATTGGSVGQDGGSDLGNESSTSVVTESSNEFWDSLVKNIELILAVDTAVHAGNSAQPQSSQNVVANPISGVLAVRATEKQHRQVQNFLDHVLANAQRQVLIEATIVEVELGDRYQSGIDWTVVRRKGGKTITAASTMLGSNLETPPTFLLSYDRTSSEKDITGAVKLLEDFGDTKVLSSPKIIAVNNQTALLKVVDERVYFDVDLQVETDENGNRYETYTSNLHTVPVGVILAVTPQINENGNVTVNIRPSVSRITGYVADPVPRLQKADFDNLVPEIQVREMESILQVQSGQTVVLGGLMQNSKDKSHQGLPWLSSLPVVGNLFGYKDDNLQKSELVVFLRPIMITDATAQRDQAAYRKLWPEGSIEEAAGRDSRRIRPDGKGSL